jgi:hypothetical protein
VNQSQEIQHKEKSNAGIVLALAQALNDHDLDLARTYLTDDLSFEGVFGSSIGAEAYLKTLSSIRAHQNVKKTFVDGDDVCALYDLSIAAFPDVLMFGCGWFQLKNQKIHTIRVVFDPRPLSKSR